MPTHRSYSEQYEALTAGAALVQRPSGRLRCSGEDALDLLNRLSTNALMDLPESGGANTALTSNKGRIIDMLFVLRQHDRLLVITSPGNESRVREWLDFYTIIEDVEIEDITDSTTSVSLVGPASADLLSRVSRPPIPAPAPGSSVAVSVHGIEATAIRRDVGGIMAFDLIAPAPGGPALDAALTDAGAVRADPEVMERVRIEQGVPAFGAELGEAYNPLEAGLQPIISYTKGCYIGQEVIARLTTYDKVQKRLVRLRWAPGADIAPAAKLIHDGKQAGIVTSASQDAGTGAGIGLGYVRKAHSAPGSRLQSESGDTVETLGETP